MPLRNAYWCESRLSTRLSWALRSALRWFACSALILCGCAPPSPYRSEFLALGTTVRIEIADGDATHAAAAAREVEALTKRLGYEWYAWTADGGGELAQLNAALRSGQSFVVSPELAALLERVRIFFALSDGFFDPAVGKLVALWGFNGSERTDRPLPADTEIDDWVKRHPTFAAVHVVERRVSADEPLQIDLGAVGKGRVMDLAVDLLRQRGVSAALIDAGGKIRVVGENNGRPWRVAIRNPRGPEPLGWLELRPGESIATSGDYEHYAIVDGRRVHHLLDPHTGKPVTHTIAVTAIADDATTADAATTALMAAGPEHWGSIARRLHLSYALRVDASGRIEMSRGLHSRMQFSATVSPSNVSIVEW